eukprot:TRINITY_DN8977_c0_g1_i1.p1 TRINITY_DN8977_c0_g1~~TRINITY_DN8977_c0_g1_i1.p1  ORF type:complete len:824 (+),score=191.34 TRINITY_DN8977_c0_g1_i1:123-2594(+)
MEGAAAALYPSIGPGAGICTIGGRLMTPSSSVTRETDLWIQRRELREARAAGCGRQAQVQALAFDALLEAAGGIDADPDADAFEKTFVKQVAATYRKLRGPVAWRAAKELASLRHRADTVRERFFAEPPPPRDLKPAPPAVGQSRPQRRIVFPELDARPSPAGGFADAVTAVMAQGLALPTHDAPPRVATSDARPRVDSVGPTSVPSAPPRRGGPRGQRRRGRAAPKARHAAADLHSLVVGNDVFKAYDRANGTAYVPDAPPCADAARVSPRRSSRLMSADRARQDATNEHVLAALEQESQRVLRVLGDIRRWKRALLMDLRVFVHRRRARTKQAARLQSAAATPFHLSASPPRHHYLVHHMFTRNVTRMSPRPVATPTGVIIACHDGADAARYKYPPGPDPDHTSRHAPPEHPSPPGSPTGLLEACLADAASEAGETLPVPDGQDVGYALERAYFPPSPRVPQLEGLRARQAGRAPAVVIPPAAAPAVFPAEGGWAALAAPEELAAALRGQGIYRTLPRGFLDAYYQDAKGAVGVVEGVVWRDEAAYVRFAPDLAKWVPVAALRPPVWPEDAEEAEAPGASPPPVASTPSSVAPSPPDSLRPLIQDRAVRTRVSGPGSGIRLEAAPVPSPPAPTPRKPTRRRARSRAGTLTGVAVSQLLLPFAVDEPALPTTERKEKEKEKGERPATRGGKPPVCYAPMAVNVPAAMSAAAPSCYVSGDPRVVHAALHDLCQGGQGRLFLAHAAESGMLVKSHPPGGGPGDGYRQRVTINLVAPPSPRNNNNVAMQTIQRAPASPPVAAPLARMRGALRRPPRQPVMTSLAQ